MQYNDEATIVVLYIRVNIAYMDHNLITRYTKTYAHIYCKYVDAAIWL